MVTRKHPYPLLQRQGTRPTPFLSPQEPPTLPPGASPRNSCAGRRVNGLPSCMSRFDDLARREQELNMRENALKSQAEHIRKVSCLLRLPGDTELMHVLQSSS